MPSYQATIWQYDKKHFHRLLTQNTHTQTPIGTTPFFLPPEVYFHSKPKPYAA